MKVSSYRHIVRAHPAEPSRVPHSRTWAPVIRQLGS
jgi:hypothetical protein